MRAGSLYSALHPTVRPAFRVGRGWRSACAAMTRHVGCKSASNIDPYRRLTWTHLSRRFSIGDEWFIARHELHADGGFQTTPIHRLQKPVSPR